MWGIVDKMKSRRTDDKLFARQGHIGPQAYKPPYQLRRMTWEFHAYDKDFSPSVPHGHSGKYKLDVITGAVVDTTTGLIVAFLDKKEMERLLKDRKFQSLAITARQFYLENNPGASLPDIGFATNKSIIRIRSMAGRNYELRNRLIRSNRRTTIPITNRNLRYTFRTTVKLEDN